jgi:hypothetical protein
VATVFQVLHSKGGDGAAVTGATQRLLVCPKDAHWALVEAMGKRAAGGHGLNPRASRSHAVVRLVVESRPADPGETGGIVRAAHATQHLLRSRVYAPTIPCAGASAPASAWASSWHVSAGVARLNLRSGCGQLAAFHSLLQPSGSLPASPMQSSPQLARISARSP